MLLKKKIGIYIFSLQTSNGFLRELSTVAPMQFEIYDIYLCSFQLLDGDGKSTRKNSKLMVKANAKHNSQLSTNYLTVQKVV